ncbi:MAG TPA: lipopolysaccharide biosynthesis protein RfbH [Ignavibacteria bacterium]|nr:lipopolysaccharide biosynthesis protein RfbH [Ignavibacteria bacterium]
MTEVVKNKAEILKSEIFKLIEKYYSENFEKKDFIAGKNIVPVSGKVFDHEEMNYIVESALDGWFTTGRFNKEFEKELAKFINVAKCITVNSGSSANLLALASLTSEQLGDRAIKKGDEIITTPVSFPTTLNPSLLYGLVPVFVDAELPTYNIDVEKIESAIGPKTKAIMVAHTLGNPYDADKVSKIAKKNKLWLIEDCCDALGGKFNEKHVGTFGDVATLSFYPAHHITMGEGGAVFTNNVKLKKIIESFRDWGRDCWCDPGNDNTCGKRFEWQLGDLPMGYDHKYIYSHLGYNLKITDMQAALGLAQLKKLDSFIEIRNRNFERLKAGLLNLSDKLILPEATPGSEPSWFGFLITIKDNAGISRNELIAKYTGANIATRLLFAGDIRKQPYFKNQNYRVVGDLKNTEIILNNTFWLGVTPMINDEMIDYVIEVTNKIFNTA